MTNIQKHIDGSNKKYRCCVFFFIYPFYFSKKYLIKINKIIEKPGHNQNVIDGIKYDWQEIIDG